MVDAGGYGLVIMFAGVVAALRGEAPRPLEHHQPARVTHPHHHSSSYRYCTNFAVTGERPGGRRRGSSALEKIGDSVLVVGDAHTLKVHVHTDDPEEATRLFDGTAAVSRLDVADMQLQMAQRAGRLGNGGGTAATCGVLAVVSGEGMAELFDSLGATPLDGGPTLNPSTYDLLAGIHGVPAEEVVVLPNSPNVIMAAERAAELSDKTVRRRARALAAGRARRRRRARPLERRRRQRRRDGGGAGPRAHRRGHRGRARRHRRSLPPRRGGRLRRRGAGGLGRARRHAEAVLGRLATDAELVTLIAGDGVPLDQDAVTALAPDEVEVEYSYGGQPSYWWLISAE